MGTNVEPLVEAVDTRLGRALFSPVQQRVLALLFGQPDRLFQSAELIRLADSGTGATHRVVSRLADSGLVRVTMVGRQKYYQADADSPVFQELSDLVRKTIGLAGPLRSALAPFADRIVAAFVFGSIARGTDRADSDIDVMIVGDGLDYSTTFGAFASTEEILGRRINPTLMTEREWKRKRTQRDGFVQRVLESPRLFLIGCDADLG